VTTLVNGPGHPGVFFSNKVFSVNSFTVISSNGPTVESCYSRHFHDERSAHTYNYNEYSFQTYIMEDFHSNLNKLLITSFISHMLPRANPTG
jgi:hypothetical protein